jgi:hypothetical protein
LNKIRSPHLASILLSILWGSLTFASHFSSLKSAVEPPVDPRQEINDPSISSDLRKSARAVGIIISKTVVANDLNQTIRLPRTPLGEKLNLCKTERFYDQPAPGYCSGFLLTENLFVTAGHCVRSSLDCSYMAIVFDFEKTQARPLHLVPRDSVYFCQELVEQISDTVLGLDYAVIRLNRLVDDRSPLPVRKQGRVLDNEVLTTLGHPNGLPTKVVTSAQVLENTHSGYFVTELRRFSGSSGSPLLSKSGVVEGIVVRGDADYIYDPPLQCYRAKACSEQPCFGEEVTRSIHFSYFQ